MEKISNNKYWIFLGLIVVIFFGYIIYLSNQNKIDYSSLDLNKEIPVSEQSGNIAEHVLYNNGDKAVLIEYGDFQCPSCSSLAPKLKTLAEEYKDDLTFIFRNYPLEGHPNAFSAASAAEAAGLEGKYWEMNSLLFAKQSEWSTASSSTRTEFYKSYANELGIDEETFVENMKKSEITKKITFDKNLGKQAKITGTPAVFLNGNELSNEVWGDDAKLKEAIEEAIK